MGQDNTPRSRQAAQLARKKASRASHDRILIVSEGTKTEPLYFAEIRQRYKLQTANVQVHPSALGTQPLQVVEYAEQLFLNGDVNKGIQPRAFEQVYAVFDRDEHPTYHAALAKAVALDNKLRNGQGRKVKFQALASVPCFELWLLLHFEDVLAPQHRAEVYAKLRRHLPGYEKGRGGLFAATQAHLASATERGTALSAQHSAFDGVQPFTQIHELVALLIGFKAGL